MDNRIDRTVGLDSLGQPEIKEYGFPGSGSGFKRCMGCMEMIPAANYACPYCGHKCSTGSVQLNNYLPENYVLAGRYIIGRVLGSGGFGITYIAWDTKKSQKVAIKEYFPHELITRAPGQTSVSVYPGENKAWYFNAGVSKFIDEADRLAALDSHESIVRVYASFKYNGTAYIVMEYLDGETVAQRLKREGRISAEEAVMIILPVLDALSFIHRYGIIHRDIAPDNIFLTNDYKVKLIDFGSARFVAAANSEKTLTVMVKAGFSAYEQYIEKSVQTPATDVYSVGATLYKMITGQTPPSSIERNTGGAAPDPLEDIKRRSCDVPDNVAAAINCSMTLDQRKRTQTADEFIGQLTDTRFTPPPPPEPKDGGETEGPGGNPHIGLIVAIILILALCGGVVLALPYIRSALEPAEAAEQPVIQMSPGYANIVEFIETDEVDATFEANASTYYGISSNADVDIDVTAEYNGKTYKDERCGKDGNFLLCIPAEYDGEVKLRIYTHSGESVSSKAKITISEVSEDYYTGYKIYSGSVNSGILIKAGERIYYGKPDYTTDTKIHTVHETKRYTPESFKVNTTSRIVWLEFTVKNKDSNGLVTDVEAWYPVTY